MCTRLNKRHLLRAWQSVRLLDKDHGQLGTRDTCRHCVQWRKKTTTKIMDVNQAIDLEGEETASYNLFIEWRNRAGPLTILNSEKFCTHVARGDSLKFDTTKIRRKLNNFCLAKT